jgi:hypothetical protein
MLLSFWTFGTTIRIARSHRPSWAGGTADDLRFLRTVGDRWRPLLPMLDRCGTDPGRTEFIGLLLDADAGNRLRCGWFSGTEKETGTRR